MVDKALEGLIANSPAAVAVLATVLVFVKVLREMLQGVRAMLAEERQERASQAKLCHETHDRIIQRTEATMKEASDSIRECSEMHGQTAVLLQQIARGLNGREFPPRVT